MVDCNHGFTLFLPFNLDLSLAPYFVKMQHEKTSIECVCNIRVQPYISIFFVGFRQYDKGCPDTFYQKWKIKMRFDKVLII